MPFLLVLVAWGACAGPGPADEPSSTGVRVPLVAAPPAEPLEIVARATLSACDQLVPWPEGDAYLVLRGPALSRMSAADPSAETVIVENARLTGATLVATVSRGPQLLWVLVQGARAASGEARVPLLFDAGRRRFVDPLPPEARVGESAHYELRLCSISPDGQGFLVSTSGPSEKGWPRDGNRPVYHWQHARKDAFGRIPVGFDLSHYSADSRVAVFEAPYTGDFRRRAQVAMDMETGDYVTKVPDRTTEAWRPFHWETADDAQLVVTPSTRSLAGLSVAGQVYGLALPGEYEPRGRAFAAPGWGAIRLEHASGWEQFRLLSTPLAQQAIARHVADRVGDVAPLGRGNTAFSVLTHGRLRYPDVEVYLFEHEKDHAWNLLDGVERLGAIPPEFATLRSLQDRRMAHVTCSFGSRETGHLALARFHHHQADLNSVGAPAIPRKDWRRDVLVTAAGRRFVGELPGLPDGTRGVWLHDSGVLLVRDANQPARVERLTFNLDPAPSPAAPR